jgi:hypothetical protein
MPFFQKGVEEELQNVKNHCLRIVSAVYKATPVQSLQVEVSIPALPLHVDGKQVKFCLRFIESGIDLVIGEGFFKVRQFLS